MPETVSEAPHLILIMVNGALHGGTAYEMIQINKNQLDQLLKP
jgi:hypothetical protein